MVDRVGVGVPGLDDLLVRELPVYGVLVGDYNKLLYVPFEDGLEALLKRKKPIDVNKKGFVVKEFPNVVLSVLPINNELYIGLRGGDDKKSSSLYVLRENGWESLIILDASGTAASINDIVRLGPEFGNRVVVGGDNRFFSDIKGNHFISYEEFRRSDINGVNRVVHIIDNVVYDSNGGLFLDTRYVDSWYNLRRGLIRVVHEKGKFRLGGDVLRYNIVHDSPSRTRFLGRDEEDNPLFLSTVYLNYLVVNNNSIEDSDVIGDDNTGWNYFVILNNDSSRRLINVFVSGHGVGRIVHMEIDYENFKAPVVAKRKCIITGLSYGVFALGVVKSKKLHETLLEFESGN